MVFAVNKSFSQTSHSTCFGSSSRGSLSKGQQLPQQGAQFVVYSKLGWWLGRTYVHSVVADIILQTYQKLSEQLPHAIFMYAETGWSEGGPFAPHKTHQNGLSVDFMVPVVDELGVSTLLPVGMKNKFGYGIDFNSEGRNGTFQIDFESLAKHLLVLNQVAESQGVVIKSVIFDPRLQPLLFQTSKGPDLREQLSFNEKQAWVRHDEHYHVDFSVSCLPLKK